jgi:excisionase family DNA binding protein
MPLTETIVPTDDEQEIAATSSRILSRGGDLRFRVHGNAQITETGIEEHVLVPARVAQMFQNILLQLAQGKAVTIMPISAMLTTQDAADMLNVSRPFLIKLLEREKVEVQKVGNRRKIPIHEVERLKRIFQDRSKEALRDLAELGQKPRIFTKNGWKISRSDSHIYILKTFREFAE